MFQCFDSILRQPIWKKQPSTKTQFCTTKLGNSSARASKTRVRVPNIICNNFWNLQWRHCSWWLWKAWHRGHDPSLPVVPQHAEAIPGHLPRPASGHHRICAKRFALGKCQFDWNQPRNLLPSGYRHAWAQPGTNGRHDASWKARNHFYCWKICRQWVLSKNCLCSFSDGKIYPQSNYTAMPPQLKKGTGIGTRSIPSLWKTSRLPAWSLWVSIAVGNWCARFKYALRTRCGRRAYGDHGARGPSLLRGYAVPPRIPLSAFETVAPIPRLHFGQRGQTEPLPGQGMSLHTQRTLIRWRLFWFVSREVITAVDSLFLFADEEIPITTPLKKMSMVNGHGGEH